ncbi:clarin-1 [Apteryx mantelli]|uniref:Clarin-1 n=1 Tax=Apteryx mantelli TaxID=2696672 RepID=A0ABM4EZZ3_9AVES
MGRLRRQRRALLCAAGLLSLAGALGAAAALGAPRWVRAAPLCRTGALLVNASGPELRQFLGELRYGLFQGQRLRQCGLGGRPLRFAFFPDLLQVIPASIHVSVIVFCTALVAVALVGTGFFLYNAFGSPYETLHGPAGLYLCSFIACSCGCLILVLFSSEVKVHHLSEKIANFKEESFTFKTHSEQFDSSFWIILVCSLVHFLNAILIRFAGFEFPFSKPKDSGTTTGAADLMY